jgi:RimJ/RimL family protein N-acetyltransferase
VSALRGFGVSLEPLTPAHVDELVRVGDDVVWRYQPMAPGPLPRTPDEHRAWWTRWLELAERGIANGEEVFCVRRDLDGALVGSTRYLNVAAAHRRREIGGTFYRADARGNAVNPACKRLLLARAFDELACVRVELKCDARNLASRAAIAKLGAQEEGTFRRHMILGDGHIRDTVYFSILDSEWPAVRSRLDERLKRAR